MSAAVSKAPAPAEHKTRPEKPDENAYKIDLAQAEKNLSAAQKKLVRGFSWDCNWQLRLYMFHLFLAMVPYWQVFLI